MKNEPTIQNFGQRLAKLRRARGLTQQQLGDLIEVSKRVIAYYEGETKYPPSHLIVPLSKALKISTDELLGATTIKDALDPKIAKLWRKMKILESFSEKDKKAVLQYVEIIAERNKAQQKTK